MLGFGLHGFGHLAIAAARRGGTFSGAATAPTMVIPFWLWARKELAKEGITDVDRLTSMAIAAAGAPMTLAMHALTYNC